jgi:hypothetical protein
MALAPTPMMFRESALCRISQAVSAETSAHAAPQHPGSGIEPVVCALKYGCRALCVRWAEAQSGPGAVDGDLAHGLHAMAGKGSGEPVAVQVCPKLSALRVADPGQAVRLRCGYRSILSVTPGGAWVAVAGEREAE